MAANRAGKGVNAFPGPLLCQDAVTRAFAAASEPARVIAMQIVITLAGAGVAAAMSGFAAALSALFGGSLACVNSVIALGRIERAERLAVQSAAQAFAALCAGAVFRYLLVVVLFALGFGVLALLPGPAVAVFAAAQIAYGLSFGRTQ